MKILFVWLKRKIRGWKMKLDTSIFFFKQHKPKEDEKKKKKPLRSTRKAKKKSEVEKKKKKQIARKMPRRKRKKRQECPQKKKTTGKNNIHVHYAHEHFGQLKLSFSPPVFSSFWGSGEKTPGPLFFPLASQPNNRLKCYLSTFLS